MRCLQIAACLVLVLLPAPSSAAGGGAGFPAGPGLTCRQLIEQAERALRIPAQLLSAISLTESGRWSERREEHIAWPWTIHAEGRGRYFATKEEAVAAVRRLKARDVSNIDVGCMQVNLHYHAHAFDSLEEAFDPATNVAYAATFLKNLKERSHSWTRAIGLYHSSTRTRQSAYRDRVTRFWHIERRRAAMERIAETRAAWIARRAARQTARAARSEP